MQQEKKDVLRETDSDAIRLAKTLIRSARFGALAVLEPETHAPFVSRVAVATDQDGTPLILVSKLSGHTSGLLADQRCSLLLGEPGKGDALAHPRITISCHAVKMSKDDEGYNRIEGRFLSRNPKSKLYAGFSDFSYFKLVPLKASLNGGFGKAYVLTADDLLTSANDPASIASAEQSAVEHMNEDHADAVARLARYYGKNEADVAWKMTGIDADGFDLAAGDHTLRIFFEEPLNTGSDIHTRLVMMAVTARKAETQN
ncbi:HugZ family protein [Brucellaceae bacterium C25G]